MMEILVDCLPGFEPVYKHEGDAGADLRANLTRPVTIAPGDSAWVGTGVKVEPSELMFVHRR